MSNVIFWPNDFSPAYDVEYNDKKEFVRLNAVWSLPPDYPGAYQVDIEQHYIDYIKDTAWDDVLKAIGAKEYGMIKEHKKYRSKITGKVFKVFCMGKVKIGEEWNSSVAFYDKGMLKMMTVSEFLFEYELKQ
jgi:hypothetical protein